MLKQRLQNDANSALKSQDQFTCGVLRMAISSINAKEKEKRYKLSKEDSDIKEEDLLQAAVLSDDEIIGVLSSEIKKRKDSIEAYAKGGRQELADKEAGEIKILEKYLPEQLSDEELEKIIKEIISLGAADFGKVIGQAMAKVKGRADGHKVGGLVKKLLVK